MYEIFANKHKCDMQGISHLSCILDNIRHLILA